MTPSDRLTDSILRENETWAERCRELIAENAALRAVVDDLASAARDAQRAVRRGDYEAWRKPRSRRKEAPHD